MLTIGGVALARALVVALVLCGQERCAGQPARFALDASAFRPLGRADRGIALALARVRDDQAQAGAIEQPGRSWPEQTRYDAVAATLGELAASRWQGPGSPWSGPTPRVHGGYVRAMEFLLAALRQDLTAAVRDWEPLASGWRLAVSGSGVRGDGWGASRLDGWLAGALRGRDLRLVEDLLRAGADPETLVVAGMRGHPPSLVGSGAADSGVQALTSAVQSGELAEVRLLLRYGADPNRQAVASPLDPLRVACGRGDVGAVRLLLAAGADPNCADEGGRTPLMEVLSTTLQTGMRRAAAARLSLALLDAGADPSATDRSGSSATTLARRADMGSVLRRLRRECGPP